jgi:hypothetical protein
LPAARSGILRIFSRLYFSPTPAYSLSATFVMSTCLFVERDVACVRYVGRRRTSTETTIDLLKFRGRVERWIGKFSALAGDDLPVLAELMPPLRRPWKPALFEAGWNICCLFAG